MSELELLLRWTITKYSVFCVSSKGNHTSSCPSTKMSKASRPPVQWRPRTKSRSYSRSPSGSRSRSRSRKRCYGSGDVHLRCSDLEHIIMVRPECVCGPSWSRWSHSGPQEKVGLFIIYWLIRLFCVSGSLCFCSLVWLDWLTIVNNWSVSVVTLQHESCDSRCSPGLSPTQLQTLWTDLKKMLRTGRWTDD